MTAKYKIVRILLKLDLRTLYQFCQEANVSNYTFAANLAPGMLHLDIYIITP